MVNYERLDVFRNTRRPSSGLVVVPTGPGLLPQATQLADDVRRSRVGLLRVCESLTAPDGPADIIPCEIAHSERTHRKAKPLDGTIHLRRQCPLIQQKSRLAQVRV